MRVTLCFGNVGIEAALSLPLSHGEPCTSARPWPSTLLLHLRIFMLYTRIYES